MSILSKFCFVESIHIVPSTYSHFSDAAGDLYFTEKQLGEIMLARLLLRNWLDKFDRDLRFVRRDIFKRPTAVELARVPQTVHWGNGLNPAVLDFHPVHLEYFVFRDRLSSLHSSCS
jgi:hypothetical protein